MKTDILTLIVGGASGVDYMAERWADNSRIPLAVFSEEWGDSGHSKTEAGPRQRIL